MLFGVPAFSCGRESEPQASDKPVCCNAFTGGDPEAHTRMMLTESE